MNTPSQLGPVSANIACFASMMMWSINFPAGEVLLESWGAISLLTARFTPAVALLLLIWVLTEGPAVVRSAPWHRGLGVGGLGFGIGSIFFLIGQRLSDPVTPAIAAAMMPIFGAMLEVLLDSRRLRFHLLVGLTLALSGGYLASGVNLADAIFGLGALLCLVSVVLFAWATRSTTRDFPTLSTLGRTTITFAGGVAFVIVACGVAATFGFGETDIGLLDRHNILLLVVSAFLASATAQVLWIWGAGGLGILAASFHMNAVPFYVMVILSLMMGGQWNWNQAFGAAMVAAGVAVSQSRGRVRQGI